MQNHKDELKSKNVENKDLKNADIVSVILEDHKPLKEYINIMKDSESSPEERISAFKEFAPTLVAHAKPEEEVLYTFMKKDEDFREEALEGDVEHGLVDQLVEEIKRTDDQDLKCARIKVLAELVEHHIEEEEEEMLPEFKMNSEIADRARLGNKFLEVKLNYLAAGSDNVIPDPKSEKIEALKH